MANKTTNLSTTSEKVAKSAYQLSDEFLNLHTMKKQPVYMQWLENLSEKLVNWAVNDENALTLTSFYVKQGICSRTAARWRKRSEVFEAAHEFAKMAIGTRRELGALKKKFDSGIVMRSMAMYDNNWKALEEWRTNLKNKEQENKGTTFTVVMPSYLNNENEKQNK